MHEGPQDPSNTDDRAKGRGLGSNLEKLWLFEVFMAMSKRKKDVKNRKGIIQMKILDLDAIYHPNRKLQDAPKGPAKLKPRPKGISRDILRYSGLRISEAEDRYLRRLGRKISKWVPPGRAFRCTGAEGEWIFTPYKASDIMEDDE